MIKNIYNKYKKMLLDFFINILASMILTLTLQLALYPYMAKVFSTDEYGLILVIMGIYNTIISTIGTSLNNIRLVKNEKYINSYNKGDFNLILTVFCVIGFISSYLIFTIGFNITLITKFFLIIAIILGIIKSYSSVIFRINLNFKLILVLNCITAIGYVIGLLLVGLTEIWPISFCLGELTACSFIWKKTNILNEPLTKTKMFRETFNDFVILVFTNLIANLLTYLDRLIILPFLGTEKVAIYTVASFFGKSIGILMIPIAGVLLGYYSQKNFKMSNKIFWKINSLVVIIGVFFYLISYVISPWFTGILYPSIIDAALPYIALANLAAIIGVVASIVHPSVLKYAPIKWQIVTQLIYGFIYLGIGIVMVRYSGLRGFCYAAITANVVRLFLLVSIGTIYLKKGRRCEDA